MAGVNSYFYNYVLDYDNLTLDDCKAWCEENNYEITQYEMVVCTGFVVDELAPSKCWFTDYDYSYLFSMIGECNGAHCGACDGSLQLKYWNLTAKTGKSKTIPSLSLLYNFAKENTNTH